MEIAEFGVESWLNQWETQATYDIAGSSIAALTIAEFFELCKKDYDFFEKLSDKPLDYGAIEGSDCFKELVTKLYEVPISISQVLQTNGATGANLLVLYSLLEEGDHVISIFPSYQQLFDIPKSLGIEVSLWRLQEEREWLPSIDELESLIRPNTKMICLNNANNPTGTVFSRKFLQEIVDIASRNNIYILVDEVYRSFNSAIDTCSIVDLYEMGISTNSLSKNFSVPGLRVGWVVANEELSDIFRKYRDYTMISAGVINDEMAQLALENRDNIWDRNKVIVKENWEIFSNWLENERDVSIINPNGVSTSFIKFEFPISDIEKFCVELLKEEGVLIVPGSRFGYPQHARVGYCANKEVLREALIRLSKFIKNYRDK